MIRPKKYFVPNTHFSNYYGYICDRGRNYEPKNYNMKKKFLTSLVVVLLTSCGGNGNKPEEITKSLKEVMTSFLTARN